MKATNWNEEIQLAIDGWEGRSCRVGCYVALQAIVALYYPLVNGVEENCSFE
jgi:hypothetical protein